MPVFRANPYIVRMIVMSEGNIMRKLPFEQRRISTSISFDQSILKRIENLQVKSRSDYINVALDEIIARDEKRLGMV